MSSTYPDLQFSLAEFEQAGLLSASELHTALAGLPAAHYQTCDDRACARVCNQGSALPDGLAPQTHSPLQPTLQAACPLKQASALAMDIVLDQTVPRPDSHHSNLQLPFPSPDPRYSNSKLPASSPEHLLPSPSPAPDTKLKKELNCKYQKTFRERQKVLFLTDTLVDKLCCSCYAPALPCTLVSDFPQCIYTCSSVTSVSPYLQ